MLHFNVGQKKEIEGLAHAPAMASLGSLGQIVHLPGRHVVIMKFRVVLGTSRQPFMKSDHGLAK